MSALPKSLKPYLDSAGAKLYEQIVASGGMILPDALYTLHEVARLIGRSERTVRRLLDEPGPLLVGLHRDGAGQLVRGSAVLAYQDSIRVSR